MEQADNNGLAGNVKIRGEAMAIKISEIGAQGTDCKFVVLSKDEQGHVHGCSGSFGYEFEGEIIDGDVMNTDLEKALPIIAQTGVARLYSCVRGHFKSPDGKWLHLDTGCGNHFFVRDVIAEAFLDRFEGARPYDVYMKGVEVAREVMA